jgi:hypothetical protein
VARKARAARTDYKLDLRIGNAVAEHAAQHVAVVSDDFTPDDAVPGATQAGGEQVAGLIVGDRA